MDCAAIGPLVALGADAITGGVGCVGVRVIACGVKRVALSGIATYPHAPRVAVPLRNLSAVSWVDWSAQMLGDRRSCLVPPLVGARAFCLGVCVDRSVVGAAGRAYWDCLVAGVK